MLQQLTRSLRLSCLRYFDSGASGFPTSKVRVSSTLLDCRKRKNTNFEWSHQWHTSTTHIKIRQNLSSDSGVETYGCLDSHEHSCTTVSCALRKKHRKQFHNFVTVYYALFYMMCTKWKHTGLFASCLCVCFNMRNAGTDFDEMRYGYYVKFVLSFPTTSNCNKKDAWNFSCERHYRYSIYSYLSNILLNKIRTTHRRFK
jgi:hypothetical protein